MLVRYRRRWPNNKPTLGQCLLFAAASQGLYRQLTLVTFLPSPRVRNFELSVFKLCQLFNVIGHESIDLTYVHYIQNKTTLSCVRIRHPYAIIVAYAINQYCILQTQGLFSCVSFIESSVNCT